MCKYCDPDFGENLDDEMIDTMVGQTDIDCGVMGKHNLSLWINNRGISAMLMDRESEMLGEVCVAVNYCPMCGRKLG